MNQTLIRAIWPQVFIIGTSVLSGCGGGSSVSSSTTTSSQLPAPVALTSSTANLKAFIGDWAAGCGFVLNGGAVKSVRNLYKLTSQDGVSVSGTFEQYQYSDSDCTKPWPSAGLPAVTWQVTLKVLSSTDVGTPTGAYNNFIGTADKVEIASRSSSGALYIKTSFAAFSELTSLRFTDALPFSSADLVYKK